MSIAGLRGEWVTGFRGPVIVPQVEVSDVPSDSSLRAENVQYGPGRVQTREGHEAMFNPAAPVTGLYNWYTSSFNKLIYFRSGNTVVSRDLATGVETTIGTVSAYSATSQQASSRLYQAFHPGSGSTTEARVLNQFGDYNKIAPGPISVNSITPSDQGAGYSTAGKKRIGFLIESKSGYIGKPCPLVSGVFTPTEFTFAEGRSYVINVNANWPTWAAKVWLIITTSENLDKYFFVPGGSFNVAPGVATYGGLMNISDEGLELNDDEVVENFNFLTQDGSGSGPIKPTTLIAYSRRMVYIADTAAYVSERDNFEAFTGDNHVIRLPGEKKMTATAAMGGVLYLFGPTYTYKWQDTGDLPVLSPPPAEVSGSIGCPGPNAVTANTDYGYAWVCSEGGLYFFDGQQYPEVPSSFFQTPIWKRINWAYAHTIQVVDHTATQRVEIIVPLDAATTPSHRLVFDYSEGKTPGKIKFSLDYIGSSWLFGSVGLCRNNNTGRIDVIYGCGTSGPVLRKFSAAEMQASPGTRYHDNATAISSVFQTGPQPGRDAATQRMRHRGVELRIQGAGTMTPVVKSLDGTVSKSLAPITLAASPDNTVIRRYHTIAMKATYEFSLNVLNSHFILSGLKHYASPFI
jgi:hypothetical protein